MAGGRAILVTGGAGYIGSHACKALSLAGYTPVAFDSFRTGWREAVKFGPLEEGDLLDRARVLEAFQKWRPAAVMHFAALSLVGESIRDPGLYWRQNIGGAVNLAEAMAQAGCLRIVLSSTCAVYGEQDGVLLTEESPPLPMNPYGSSKRAVEEVLRDFGQSHGVESAIFRYFNVAGADPEGEIGELHDPETHLVPVVLDAVAGTRPEVTIFGSDYGTPDGTCVRDYVHVWDLAQAHVLGLEWLLAGNGSRVFNLGTGRGFSVREVIDHARLITNRSVPFREGPRRKGDAESLVSGSERAQRELGWRLERSDMRSMISDAWRWHQSPRFGA